MGRYNNSGDEHLIFPMRPQAEAEKAQLQTKGIHVRVVYSTDERGWILQEKDDDKGTIINNVSGLSV